jgi:hypothetical protein
MYPTQASGSGRISRRTLLKAATATALAELETPANAAAGFFKAVDISWVPFTAAPTSPPASWRTGGRSPPPTASRSCRASSAVG